MIDFEVVRDTTVSNKDAVKSLYVEFLDYYNGRKADAPTLYYEIEGTCRTLDERLPEIVNDFDNQWASNQYLGVELFKTYVCLLDDGFSFFNN